MEIAILISSASAAVSVFALGWNFYRDVILKSRTKGSISISNVYHGSESHGPFLSLTFVNMGPGKLHLESIYIAKLSWLRFLGRRVAKIFGEESKYAHIMWDYTNDYSSKLPISLDVGEKASFLLKSNQEAFLSVNPTHVGVTDSFGRLHWVSSGSLKVAKSEYFQQYSEKPWGF
ncbi:MAG: hypothetical protein K2X00_09905 [Nitrospiraceae bacterium]|nr:hypothetical protein [Nitrospiraceae bacterium]